MRTARHRRLLHVRRAVRGTVLAAVVSAAAVGACSSDDGDDGAEREPSTTTVGTTTDGGGATTTEPGGADTTEGGDTPTTTSVEEPEPGDREDWGRLDAPTQTGTVDGHDVVLEIRREGAAAELRTGELTLSCMPLLDGDEATSRTTTVEFTGLEVREDGSVEADDPDAPFKPALSGFFAEDGSFTGSVFLSDVVDDHACGGEFPLLLPAP